MVRTTEFPKTLQAAIQYFSDDQTCIDFLAEIRWPDGKAVCGNCSDKENTYYLHNQKRWKCRSCKKQFSVKANTIFEESPLSLSTWFPAVWLICGAKNGISSYEIHRALGVTQKTAWFMLHRIRLAMTQGSFEIGGEGETIEVDETYIGGKARNMHADRRRKTLQGRTGGAGKQAVFGMLERGKDGKSKIRTRTIPEAWKNEVGEIIRETIKKGTNVYSDEHGAYYHLGSEGFNHAFVRHAEYYFDGAVHTNGVENFWTLLKRTIKGTYVSIEPFHTFRYLDEQAFRFNERFGDDADRFITAMHEVAGRRVTYKKLTGKDGDVSPSVNGEANERPRP